MSGLEKKVRWGEVWKEHGKPLEFYHEHYPGLKRGELFAADQSLYKRLLSDSLLDPVPLKNPNPTPLRRDFGDPVVFYKKHYLGLTRGELNNADPSLYQRLRRDGLLEVVPLGNRSRASKFGDDPVAYYKKHHPGLTRGQLWAQAPGLYHRLYRDGLLDDVPLKIRDFGDDPVAYCKKHYPGLTRGQLDKEDRALYNRLWRDGLLEEIPLSITGKPRKYGDDPAAYYKEHFPGLTRSQLQKQVPGLYNRLWNDDLLEHVLLAKGKFGEDALAYYHEHFPGLTRGRLKKADRSLYGRLRRDGLLKHVPLAKKKK